MTLEDIRPRRRDRVMDLVAKAGVDVSDWKNFKGKSPSTNPKYCYEWSFIEPGKVAVLSLWLEKMEIHDDEIIYPLRLGERLFSTSNAERRTLKMDRDVQTAILEELPIRVIVCSGRDPSGKTSNVAGRALDPTPWAIAEYDFERRDYSIVRGGKPLRKAEVYGVEFDGFEGELRQRYVRHRSREAHLRKLKIKETLERSERLACEVPGCGFDFAARYGALGHEYAQVHHLIPLNAAPASGRSVTLADVAIVCANCHVMIHRGGECRPLPD
ncbi:MAG TPA: HNH endonuclease [Caulobacterales bacterium]|nr:HNH endonuclease [Caulobacterales bacterium]